jgi:hypothetical protein
MVAYQFKGTDCPVPFKVVLQFVFVFETLNGVWGRMLPNVTCGHEPVPVATGVIPRDPAKDPFTVLPQYLERFIDFRWADARGGVHGWRSFCRISSAAKRKKMLPKATPI